MTVDLGTYSPATALPPTRSLGGQTELGRVTTSDEQRADAIRYITSEMDFRSETVGRAVIAWGNREPTILEVTVVHETLGTKLVAIMDSVLEMTLAGAEIPFSEEARFRELNDEIADLHERKML